MDPSIGKIDFAIQRRELFNHLRSHPSYPESFSGSLAILKEYVQQKIQQVDPNFKSEENVAKGLRSFLTIFRRHWQSSNRCMGAFTAKYANWLDEEINISSNAFKTTKRGRTVKDFSACASRTKLLKVRPIVEKYTLEELCLATECKLRQAGRRDAATMLKELISSPTRATNLKKQATASLPQNQYSSEEALSLITYLKLTHNQYITLRKRALEKSSKLYPSYYQIKLAKTLCYPPASEIVVTDISAEIRLQAVVDHTIKRFLEVKNDLLNTYLASHAASHLCMTIKWGSDGCGSLSRYKQKSSENVDDSCILLSSCVLLQVCGFSEGSQKKVLWVNPSPSSTRFCRPIRFQFVKETAAEIVEEFTHVRKQISELEHKQWGLNNDKFVVRTEFLETMVDGKVCNALSGNKTSQKCYICGATSKDMNQIEAVTKRKCQKSTFSWGLSVLHCYIRFMECLLHISYKLCVKKWQVRDQEEKESVAQRKSDIIENFKKETGLLLDTPRQGGGNTNDGNTARRFFQDPQKTAAITGIDPSLIEKFSTILRVLSSGYDINFKSFEKYCLDTAHYYTRLYHWYFMPVTVHKVLIHGPLIIQSFLLPIGQLTEEVQESRHKEVKRYRESFSRKISRKATNIDILNNLLISSDPVITNLMPLPSQRSLEVDQNMRQLVIVPPLCEIESDDSEIEENLLRLSI